MRPRCVYFRYTHVTRGEPVDKIQSRRLRAGGGGIKPKRCPPWIRDDRRPATVPCASVGIEDTFAQKSLNYAKFRSTCLPSRLPPPRRTQLNAHRVLSSFYGYARFLARAQFIPEYIWKMDRLFEKRIQRSRKREGDVSIFPYILESLVAKT